VRVEKRTFKGSVLQKKTKKDTTAKIVQMIVIKCTVVDKPSSVIAAVGRVPTRETVDKVLLLLLLCCC
jgi:hypothetical protein